MMVSAAVRRDVDRSDSFCAPFRLLLPRPWNAQWRALAAWERAAQAVFAIVLLAGSAVAVSRMIHDAGSDFLEYHSAGRYVVEHGARDPRTILLYYWPSLDAAWAAFGWMPFEAAACAWCAISCWTWFGLLGAIHRYLLETGTQLVSQTSLAQNAAGRQTLLITALLVLPVAMLHLALGAFHVLMLWWLVAGLGRVSEGRTVSGGIILGLAVWVKLLPVLAVGYLLVKRQWRPALLAVTVAVGVDVLLSVAAFGPRAAWEAHCTWWQKDSVSTTDRILLSDDWQYEHRYKNQSLAAVTRRLFTPVIAEPAPNARPTNLLDLPRPAVKAIYFAALGAIGLALLFAWRRTAADTSPGQWAGEIALVVLATMWFSPVMWAYYFTAIAPPLAVALGRRDAHPRLARVTAGVWLATLVGLGWPPARVVGLMLWCTFYLGAVLVVSRPIDRCNVG